MALSHAKAALLPFSVLDQLLSPGISFIFPSQAAGQLLS